MREFGLIGYPLGHSFSKKYFSEKFCKEGIEAGYELFAIPDLDRDTLYRLLAEKPDLVGFNVTVPYKEKIAALCDSLSEDAAAIGAVNIVPDLVDKITALFPKKDKKDTKSAE